MEFKQTQLDNGLTIIAEVMPAAKSMAMGFFVRTGSRDETPEVSGVSHFLEHMMFKGTDKRTVWDVNLEFDRMGAQYNAFTSEENTVYYAAVLPEFQSQILDLWADLMRPALRQEDFDTEKGVICEEIAMYQDMPHFDVLDRCRKLHFADHGCGNSVLGTVESIQAMQRDQMHEYFSRRYSPDNIVLSCAGKLDWDALVAQANELCGHWEPSNAERSLVDFPGTAVQEVFQNDKVTREHVCLIAAAPSAQSPMRYAASLLANVIGDDTGSRLYWALVDSALADSADLEYEPLDGTGAFYAYVSCDPDQTSKVLGIVSECLAKVRQEGITEKELQAAKNKISSSVTLQGELPMGRLVPLGFGWTYRKEYRPLADELVALNAVTLDEINELLKQYPLENITRLGLGPIASI